MNLSQLNQLLKKQIQKQSTNCPIQIYYPWELLKMKHLSILEVRFPTAHFCIRKENGLWEVFHIEKGYVSNEKVFEQEKDACKYFIGWVTKALK